jgi:hypothetical protein
VRRAYFFAADARVRESRGVLKEGMPWLRTETLPSPEAVLKAGSAEPSVLLFDDTGLAILDPRRLRAARPGSVLILFSFQPFIQCAPPQAAAQKYPYTASADLVFAVDRGEFSPEKIVLPAVRAAEDRLNIKQHSKLKRFIFHIVDDEPRWFSQFLPVLYGIIGQRADVMITRTYEESLSFLFGVEDESEIGAGNTPRGHGDDVVCLITDIFFPRGDELQSDCGRDLIRLVDQHYPRIPIIIASKTKEARRLREPGFILPKGDPGSLQKLKDYILNFTGMGEFLVTDEDGRELARAKNIRDICDILGQAEKETEAALRLRRLLENYGEKDKFSTWLYMHSYPELGDRLRPRRSRGRELITLLKRNLGIEIARLARTPLDMGGKKVFHLSGLLAALRSLSPEEIQPYSDNDVLSSWLDRQGFSELAEELRPIHGSGAGLQQTLVEVVERWALAYRERGIAV